MPNVTTSLGTQVCLLLLPSLPLALLPPLHRTLNPGTKGLGSAPTWRCTTLACLRMAMMSPTTVTPSSFMISLLRSSSMLFWILQRRVSSEATSGPGRMGQPAPVSPHLSPPLSKCCSVPSAPLPIIHKHHGVIDSRPRRNAGFLKELDPLGSGWGVDRAHYSHYSLQRRAAAKPQEQQLPQIKCSPHTRPWLSASHGR